MVKFDYSVLYGPLDGSTVYRHTHKFVAYVTGAKVTAVDMRVSGFGNNDWIDVQSESDADMPEGFNYPG